jgi:hypothetical protein
LLRRVDGKLVSVSTGRGRGNRWKSHDLYAVARKT